MFFIFIYICSLISLLIIRNHIFLCLLRLEFIVVSLLIIYFYSFIFLLNGIYMLIIIMVFFVCEGVLGLRILVRIIRCYGNDYLNSMSLW